MRLTPTILDAISYAAIAHKDQKRKYTNEPYIVHPLEVVKILDTYLYHPDISDDTSTEEMFIAAILHDVVEDTEVTMDDIFKYFGPNVWGLVYWLTDEYPETGWNRAKRKQYDRDRIAAAPRAAKLIKLADLISNTSDITEHDPHFAVVYMKEKERLLDKMTDVSDTELYTQARAILDAWKKKRKENVV